MGIMNPVHKSGVPKLLTSGASRILKSNAVPAGEATGVLSHVVGLTSIQVVVYDTLGNPLTSASSVDIYVSLNNLDFVLLTTLSIGASVTSRNSDFYSFPGIWSPYTYAVPVTLGTANSVCVLYGQPVPGSFN